MIDAFHDHLSQIYWEGFADQLLNDDPDRYQWEFNDYLSVYCTEAPVNQGFLSIKGV